MQAEPHTRAFKQEQNALDAVVVCRCVRVSAHVSVRTNQHIRLHIARHSVWQLKRRVIVWRRQTSASELCVNKVESAKVSHMTATRHTPVALAHVGASERAGGVVPVGVHVVGVSHLDAILDATEIVRLRSAWVPS